MTFRDGNESALACDTNAPGMVVTWKMNKSVTVAWNVNTSPVTPPPPPPPTPTPSLSGVESVLLNVLHHCFVPTLTCGSDLHRPRCLRMINTQLLNKLSIHLVAPGMYNVMV